MSSKKLISFVVLLDFILTFAGQGYLLAWSGTAQQNSLRPPNGTEKNKVTGILKFLTVELMEKDKTLAELIEKRIDYVIKNIEFFEKNNIDVKSNSDLLVIDNIQNIVKPLLNKIKGKSNDEIRRIIGIKAAEAEIERFGNEIIQYRHWKNRLDELIPEIKRLGGGLRGF